MITTLSTGVVRTVTINRKRTITRCPQLKAKLSNKKLPNKVLLFGEKSRYTNRQKSFSKQYTVSTIGVELVLNESNLLISIRMSICSNNCRGPTPLCKFWWWIIYYQGQLDIRHYLWWKWSNKDQYSVHQTNNERFG